MWHQPAFTRTLTLRLSTIKVRMGSFRDLIHIHGTLTMTAFSPTPKPRALARLAKGILGRAIAKAHQEITILVLVARRITRKNVSRTRRGLVRRKFRPIFVTSGITPRDAQHISGFSPIATNNMVMAFSPAAVGLSRKTGRRRSLKAITAATLHPTGTATASPLTPAASLRVVLGE